jgi:ketosteroid isomerase-like protein
MLAIESEERRRNNMRGQLKIHTLVFLAIAMLRPPSLALATERTDGAAAIRAELAAWTQAYNSRQGDKICHIFSEDLRYKFGEVPDRGYNDVCPALRLLLSDKTRQSHYTLDLREILVYGDIAVVRLIWILDESKTDSRARIRSLEPGMDIFHRQKDGSWKIIRYLAYTTPE